MTRDEPGGTEALRAALRRHGGTVGGLLDEPEPFTEREPGFAEPQNLAPADTGRGPAQIAASGPRAQGREREYELLVEMILEGSRLHYGPERVVRTDDPDLALLIGDQMYALGLSRLAALGDLDAVRALADVIAEVARAEAAGDRAAAESAWTAGARRVGWAHPPDGLRDEGCDVDDPVD